MRIVIDIRENDNVYDIFAKDITASKLFEAAGYLSVVKQQLLQLAVKEYSAIEDIEE